MGGAAAVVDVEPVGLGVDRDHLGAGVAQRPRTGLGGGAVGAVEDDLEPRRAGGSMVPSEVGGVLARPPASYGATRPTSPPVGRCQASRSRLLDRDLDGVVELDAAAGEELDAVVGHRVVRGGEHHAEVGAERVGQVGDARASAAPRAGARRRRPRPGRPPPRPRGTAPRSGCPGRRRPAGRWPSNVAALGEDVRRGNGQVQGQLGGQIDRWPGPGPRRCRRGASCDATAAISAC